MKSELNSTTKRRALPGEEAFTLLEIILALSLLVVMISVLYGAFTGITRSTGSMQSTRSIYRSAAFFFNRLNIELTAKSKEALWQKHAPLPESIATTPYPSTARVVLRGKSKKIFGKQADSLRFVSINGAQEFFGGVSNVGTVEIEYRLEEDPVQKKHGSTRDKVRRLVLVREEMPAGMADHELAKKRRIIFPVANNVVSLSFQYLRDGKWREEWKDAGLGFPEAIQVSIELVGEDDRIEKFRTAFLIERKRPQSFVGFNTPHG